MHPSRNGRLSFRASEKLEIIRLDEQASIAIYGIVINVRHIIQFLNLDSFSSTHST